MISNAIIYRIAPRLYFWHLAPGNPAARASIMAACYRAYAKSRTGQRILAAMKKIKGQNATTRALVENTSYQSRQEQDWAVYMRVQQSALLNGEGDEEHISLMHSWMGHVLYVAVQRLKRLPRGTVAYQELRQNTVRLICRGRRALVSAWQRWAKTKQVGFNGAERWAFLTGFDEAELLSNHASRREMRAAFEYAESLAKTKGLKVVKADYHY